MRALTTFAFLLSLLVCASPLAAQELPGQAKDPRARAAQRYETKTWPAAGHEVAGWSPDSFKVAGWDRLRVRVDARRAEAHVDFALTPLGPLGSADAKPAAKRPAARLRIRRHVTSAAARDVLLAHLAACTQTLGREEGLGEVAFGTRVDGRLVYLAGARGDLSYVLRATGDEDLQPVASALDAQLRQASKPRKEAPVAQARLSKSVAGEALPGKPLAIGLSFSGSVRSLYFKAPEGVSVLRTKTGCVVYSDQPGPVEFELLVLDAELRTSRQVLRATLR